MKSELRDYRLSITSYPHQTKDEVRTMLWKEIDSILMKEFGIDMYDLYEVTHYRRCIFYQVNYSLDWIFEVHLQITPIPELYDDFKECEERLKIGL